MIVAVLKVEGYQLNVMFSPSGKDPVPIRCPVAGAFNFTQDGDFKFKTRILGGITKDPRHDVWGRTGQFSCKQNISRYDFVLLYQPKARDTNLFVGNSCWDCIVHQDFVNISFVG